jgi:hypothetical protein
MDAVKFQQEVARMCYSVIRCAECGLHRTGCGIGAVGDIAEKRVEIVEQWSEENPVEVNRKEAEDAVAEYLSIQDIKRYGRPRLANSEYLIVAKEILEGRQHGETDADTVEDEQLD